MEKNHLEIIVLFETGYTRQDVIEDYKEWSGLSEIYDELDLKKYYKYSISTDLQKTLTKIFKKDSWKNLSVYLL